MYENATWTEERPYMKNGMTPKPDYGWQFQGKKVLLLGDSSLAYNDAEFEMASILREMSLAFPTLDNCLQCGICTSKCSNALVSADGKRSPRELIQLLRLGLLDLSGPDLWFCSNCGGCTAECPSEVPFIDVIIGLRNLVFTKKAGYFPATIKNALSSIRTFKNPWRQPPAKRSAWLEEIGISPVEGPESILLFVGCSPAYDPRNKGIAKAAARLMDRMGIAFDTLGENEVCCGDSAMRVGDFNTYDKLREVNLSGIEAKSSKEVYALSPHCFHTIKTHYFKNGEAAPRIKPFVLLLHDMLKTGVLRFNRKINKRVTYHDPCFLAKHNGIYDEPREIIKSIEGIAMVEMDHNRKGGMCCGGGGGGIWIDRDMGERLGEIRLNEALSSRAEIVVTACPHCFAMLEDAASSNPKYKGIKIMDLCEFVLEAI